MTNLVVEGNKVRKRRKSKTKLLKKILMRSATESPVHQSLSGTGTYSTPVSASSPPATASNSYHFVEYLKNHFSGEWRLQTPNLVAVIFSLAWSVDFSLTINDIPPVASALPSLIKEVYCCRDDSSLQSAIMVLLIASKRACGAGWFHTADAAAIITMANEFSCSFCLNAKGVREAENVICIISKLISRFYPRLKLCRLIASFEAKVGYVILVSDIHIPMSKPTSEEGIWLVVAQGDNLETSSCIISPPNVSFLINGKGVEKRISGSSDNRPRYPTDITKMLRNGTNIIQAIGYFSSNYIIAVAYMSEVVLSPQMLKNYDLSIAGEVTADSDITEEPSRVSLNCPIRRTRINIPVKGYLCKHHQCYDFDNFMEMNSREPTWCCPCCNQLVCFTDLRIDQTVNKVIREVSHTVDDVVISSDGSWMVLNEQNQAIAGLQDKSHEAVQVAHEENESDATLNMRTNVIDLPVEIDCGNADDNHKASNAKPYNKHEFVPSDLIGGTHIASLDAFSPTASYGGLSAPIIRQSSHIAGTPGPSIKPVIADATTVATESNSDPTAYFPASSSPQQTSQIQQYSEHVQLRQSLFENTAISTGNIRQPILREIDRIPNAVQALHVRASCSSQKAQVMNSSSSDRTCSSASHQAITLEKTIQHGQNLGNWNTGFQRRLNSPTNSSLRHNPFTQNPPINFPRQIRSSLIHQRGSDNSIPYSRVSFPVISPNSSPVPSTRASQAWTRSISPAGTVAGPQIQEPAQQVAFPSRLQPGNTALQTNKSEASLPDHPSDQHWRPTGRMRGSLTGDAYSAALSKYVTVSPPVVAPPVVPPKELSALIANDILAHGHVKR